MENMYNMYSTVMASWKQAFFGLRSVQKAVRMLRSSSLRCLKRSSIEALRYFVSYRCGACMCVIH